MVEKKSVAKTAKPAKPADASKAGSAAKAGSAKSATPAKSKSLAHGKVLFKAFKLRGKWRFINKVEAEKSHKRRVAQLAKLRSEGKKIVPRVFKKKRAPIIEKPIKGEKNGETRKIHLRRKNYYPTDKKPAAHPNRGYYRFHKRSFRSSLTPGAILVLLAGVNKGKRVILLKTMESGLLLVTGPYLLNGVPLRRVQPCHVIATKTKLDISSVELPEKVQDKMFKRVVEKRKVKKGEKTVFVPKKKSYQPNTDRKALQKTVDKQILDVIKKHPEKKPLLAYLSAMFGLKNNQYPHRMQF